MLAQDKFASANAVLGRQNQETLSPVGTAQFTKHCLIPRGGVPVSAVPADRSSSVGSIQARLERGANEVATKEITSSITV
jgi:hypothetical protein